jgi:hypothetical protein
VPSVRLKELRRKYLTEVEEVLAPLPQQHFTLQHIKPFLFLPFQLLLHGSLPSFLHALFTNISQSVLFSAIFVKFFYGFLFSALGTDFRCALLNQFLSPPFVCVLAVVLVSVLLGTFLAITH